MVGKPESRNMIHRIIYSFVPPNLSSKPQLEVDTVGSFLAISLLAAILEYGHTFKTQFIQTTPALAVLVYVTVMVAFTLVLLRADGGHPVHYKQIFTLISFSLYSHVVILAICLFTEHDDVNLAFFAGFLVLGGAACSRLVIVFMLIVRRPVLHLLLSSVVCTGHLLFLMFSFFGYVHKTFKTRSV